MFEYHPDPFDFLFGFAKSQFSEQFKIASGQYARIPLYARIQELEEPKIGHNIDFVFENWLNNQQFKVSLEVLRVKTDK